jgi:hypothetical protein
VSRRLRIWKVRLLRRIGRALSPYVWPPALVDRVTSLEENIGSQGAETPAQRLDRIEREIMKAWLSPEDSA